MIKIETIEVNAENAAKIMFGEHVYGLNKSGLYDDVYNLRPISRCDIEDITTGKVTVVKITEGNA